MLDLICDDLKTKIQALAYAEKVGSLSRIAVKYIETQMESDNGERTSVKVDEQRFPVSGNVQGRDCSSIGAYSELTPNSNKKSVMYFEQLSDIEINAETAKIRKNSVDVRLVVWLNLTKLGIDINEMPVALAQIQSELTDILEGRIIKSFTTVQVGIDISVNRIVSNPEIFTKYSYSKNTIENMLLHPFQYFAIDFTATWRLNTKCLTFTPQTEINC